MTFFINSMFLLHLLSGVFIGGTAFLIYFFIAPAVRELGPEGGKFMQILLGKYKLPTWASLFGVINIATGFYLLFIKYGHSFSWVRSNSGLVLLIGMIAGLTAWTLGTFVFQRPAAKLIYQIGAAIKESGGDATPEQMQAVDKAKLRMALGAKLSVILITITIVSMSLSLHL